MNKTINVNIGGIPFTIDEDAHLMLHSYLIQIENRLSPMERAEIMEDVENRIADIFSERLGTRVQVISTPMVRDAINVMGSAENFGEISESQSNQEDGKHAARPRLKGLGFFRSRKEKIIGGVCGGLAPAFGVDVTIIRPILVLLAFLTWTALFWVYIILWIVVPEEPITDNTSTNERR